MPFNESHQATLDMFGDAEIKLRQVPAYRKRAYIQLGVSITTGSASSGGTAKVYRGQAIPSNFLAGTIAPWLDTAFFDASQAMVRAGDQLTIVFDACDPGAIATVSATYMEERLGVLV